MDLKSMLNDSSGQRPQPPRLHTPKSSIDRAGSDHTPSYDARQTSYSSAHSAHSAHSTDPPSDYRHSANGSYFPVQSPQHTPSAHPGVGGGHPLYAQSPGPHAALHTPRENPGAAIQYHSPYVPSPSPSHPYPPTPGSTTQHHPTPSSASIYGHPAAQMAFHGQSPREDMVNGTVQATTRNISPHAQFHPPPATPLGPPATYPRPSPQSHRPLSQGHEAYRRSSVGSVGSTQSREYNHPSVAHSDHSRSGSVHRTYSGDLRERERSIESVSPRTIPKPPPQRQSSIMKLQEQMAEPLHPVQPPLTPAGVPQPQGTPDRMVDAQHREITPKSSSASVEPKPAQLAASTATPTSSTTTNNNQSVTPRPSHSPLPPQPVTPHPSSATPSVLKRRASTMTDTPHTNLPPKKRRKRDEVPLFARRARQKPLNFIQARSRPSPSKSDVDIKRGPSVAAGANGQAKAPAPAPAPAPPPPPPPQPTRSSVPPAGPPDTVVSDQLYWEPSITNKYPAEELTRAVCDWIVRILSKAPPPTDGAVIEIEGKVGSIFDEARGARLTLPVLTETVFNKEAYRGTSFKSSMDVNQHRMLNDFLNTITRESVQEAYTTDREPIHYQHSHEYDEFYELTDEGKADLSPGIKAYLSMNPRHTPRVRRTIDEKSNQVKAQIIKSRIADLEVYNPRQAFDYRISISAESPWQGNPQHLTEMPEGGRDRQKDRMSYRHCACQIDLTQVSYPGTTDKEHELEVEISTDMLRVQLDNVRAGLPNTYEQLVRRFIDNIRILCRAATPGDR